MVRLPNRGLRRRSYQERNGSKKKINKNETRAVGASARLRPRFLASNSFLCVRDQGEEASRDGREDPAASLASCWAIRRDS